jgi:hypothetical protein
MAGRTGDVLKAHGDVGTAPDGDLETVCAETPEHVVLYPKATEGAGAGWVAGLAQGAIGGFWLHEVATDECGQHKATDGGCVVRCCVDINDGFVPVTHRVSRWSGAA